MASSSTSDQAFQPYEHTVGQDDPLEGATKRRFVYGIMNLAIRIGKLWGSIFGGPGTDLAMLRWVMSATGKLAEEPGIDHGETTIAGVPVGYCIHQSERREPRPLLVYFHGGGWALSSAKAYHQFMLAVCKATGCNVVIVDYRLAPEFPYPAGLDDCLAVTKACLKADSEAPCPQLQGLIDCKRVLVGGDSAGGNFSLAVALELARQNFQPELRAVLAISPCLQVITRFYDSFQKFDEDGRFYSLAGLICYYAGVEPNDPKLIAAMEQGRHVPNETSQKLARLLAPDNVPGFEHVNKALKEPYEEYINDKIVELVTCVRAWPSLAEDSDLAKLPSVMVQVSSHETLREEGCIFAERARRAGAKDVRYCYLHPAEHDEVVLHDVLETSASQKGRDDIVDFIKSVIQ